MLSGLGFEATGGSVVRCLSSYLLQGHCMYRFTGALLCGLNVETLEKVHTPHRWQTCKVLHLWAPFLLIYTSVTIIGACRPGHTGYFESCIL